MTRNRRLPPGRPTRRRTAVAIAAMVVAASCASDSAFDRSDEFLAEGYVQQAYETVEAARARQLEDGGTVDSDLESRYRELRFRWLVERGRHAVYADDETAGRKLLEEADAMQPGDPQVKSLIERSHRKEAVRFTTKGQDRLAKGDFVAAIEAFGEALQHVPGHKPAVQGIEAVNARVAEMHGEAQQQYLEAIRKLQEQRFPEVDWHARAALKRDPTRSDAEDVRLRAMKRMAAREREVAVESLKAGSYGAALMQFKTARDLDPTVPGIDADVEAARREVEAMTKSQDALLALRGDRLDEARKLLAEAFELSTLERATVNELQLEVRRRQSELAYGAAHDLEIQGFKSEALAGYRKVAADWPDGLLDEQTRIGALTSDIEGCEKSYATAAEAEAKGELDKALEEYRAAEIYYPKYKDVAACIERVTKAIAAKAGQGGGNSGTDH